MLSTEQRQAELLDAYWLALDEEASASSPAALDPAIADLARRLRGLQGAPLDAHAFGVMRARFELQAGVMLRPARAVGEANRPSILRPSLPASWWSLVTATALVATLWIGAALAPQTRVAHRPVAESAVVALSQRTASPGDQGPIGRSEPTGVVSPSQHGTAFLGVAAQTNTPQLATRYGLPDRPGLAVTNVVAGGPAALAGLRAKDVIVAVDGRSVITDDDFARELARSRPGEKVHLTVLRGDVSLMLTLTPGRAPCDHWAEGSDGVLVCRD